MDFDILKFNITSKLQEIIDLTPKIIENNKKINFYYLKDIYNSFKSIFKVTQLSLTEFYKVLITLPEMSVTSNQDTSFSIVCYKKDYNREKIEQILNPKSVLKNNEEDFSDSSDFFKNGGKIEIIEPKNKFIKNRNKNLNLNSQFSNKKPIQQIKNQVSGNQPNSYPDILGKILDVFKYGIVIQTSSISNEMCKMHGQMFNYKNSPCQVGRHPHGNLSKYFSCCKNSFTILNLKSSYIKRIDQEADSLIKKRKSFHLKDVSFTEENSKFMIFHLECLIVNIFCCKTTLSLDDLQEVFKNVYGFTLESVCGQRVEIFINQILSSPNLYVTKSERGVSVTCIPTFNEEYKDFGNSEYFLKVQEIEQSISLGNSVVTSVSLQIEEKPTKQNTVISQPSRDTGISKKDLMAHKKINVPVSSLSIFPKYKKFTEMLNFADKNVPRSLQIRKFVCDSATLYKDMETSGVSDAWVYLYESLALDDKDLL
ncbi:hypothetical protein CWI37_1985p0010 [Hamiltosporidium tvaerminnensis]|uniref:Uncharacterized protein n=1 Tax=Hamiltosporidium tvaerminnensis TaxID=1176355 RepID=A0A4Q9KTR0_9MICR|nr:hypothetical protein CWI37_1985p0010 [Hamiltosporidium tvaerminnensis]